MTDEQAALVAADAPEIDGLDERQCRAFAVLLAGAPQSQAAAVAGVDRRTIRRWAATEEWQLAEAEARGEMFAAAIRILASKAEKAAAVIARGVDGSLRAEDRVQVEAARTVLERFGLLAPEDDKPAIQVNVIDAARQIYGTPPVPVPVPALPADGDDDE